MQQLEQILAEIGVAAVLILLNIGLQTVATIGMVIWALRTLRKAERRFDVLWRFSVVARVILAFIGIHLGQIALWAAGYLLLGCFSSVEEALYFSLATFSTSDTGSSALPTYWRLLGPFEGLAGIIGFGLSLAFIYTVISRLNETRFRRSGEAEDRN